MLQVESGEYMHAFRARLVKKNTSNKWMILVATALIALVLLVAVIKALSDYAVYLFVAAVIFIVVMAIIKGGNIYSDYISDEQLVIGPDVVQIGEVLYPLHALKELELFVNGYDGMHQPGKSDYYIHNGRNNRISFTYHGIKRSANFYLQDYGDALQLGSLLRIWYINKIPFTERNIYGQTWLFQNLAGKALEDFKREYGLE